MIVKNGWSSLITYRDEWDGKLHAAEYKSERNDRHAAASEMVREFMRRHPDAEFVNFSMMPIRIKVEIS